MSTPRPLFQIDPGWLFLIAGLALLSATVVLSAQQDLEQARWQRDCAMLVEDARLEHMDRATRLIDAIENRNPTVVLALVQSHLNLTPEGRSPLFPSMVDPQADVSLSRWIGTPQTELPDRPGPRSRLERLASDDQLRLWVLAAGMICVCIGLLPAGDGLERDD